MATKKILSFALIFAAAFAFAQGRIDRLDVDNLRLDGNTLSTRDTNGHLLLSPNGTGKIEIPGLTATTVPYLDASKRLTSSAVTPTELGYLSGVTSAIQTQINTKAPSASPTFTGTIGTPLTASRAVVTDGSSNLAVSAVTGTELGRLSGVLSSVCGITDTCTQTNKNFTAPTINGGLISFGEITNSNNFALPNGTTSDILAVTPLEGMLAYDGTQQKPVFYNGTSWTAVGSGSGGATNYISNPDAESNSTSGWTTYADAAGASLVDGTGGSPSSTWTATSTNPITGNYSFLWTKSANNRQGEGVCNTITVDSGGGAKVMEIKFDYSVASGTFVAGTSSADSDMVVNVYDVTNSTFIQPSTYKLYSSSTSPPAQFSSTFQTASITAGSTAQYRVCLHTATTSATAYTLKVDNFSVARATYAYGTPITDWTSFTPTGSWSANTTYSGFWRRTGDTIEIQYRLTTSAAPTATTLTLNLPSGYSIDTAKLAETTATIQNLGYGAILDSGTTLYFAHPMYNSTTSIQAQVLGASGTYANNGVVSNTVPMTWASGDTLNLTVRVPIAGWSSNIQVSDGYDGRIVAMRATHSTTHTINSGGTTIAYNTVGYDTHGGYNTSTGFYTVKVPGYYRATCGMRIGSSSGNTNNATDSFGITVRKSGSIVTSVSDRYNVANMIQNSRVISATDTSSYVAGDTISCNGHQEGTNPQIATDSGANVFVLERVAGPESITPGEKIYAEFTTGAAQSVTASTATIINYGTKVVDSHGAVTTGASWKFTAPRADWYHACGMAQPSAQANGSEAGLSVYKNGSSYRILSRDRNSSGGNDDQSRAGCTSLYLKAAEYIDLRLTMSTTQNLSASTSQNWITIESQ